MKDLINSLGKDGLKGAYSLLESFALYLTIAVAVILIATYLVIRFKKSQNLEKFKTLALGIILGYAITLTACISFFMIARLSVKEELDQNFYLMLGFFALLLVYAISMAVTSFMGKTTFKVVNIVGVSLSMAYGLVLLFILPNLGGDYAPLSGVGMYICSILLVVAIALPTAFFGKENGTASPTKSIAYAGVCIALSFALSYVKIFSLPQGGSVTLASMLPLIIYAYIFGARKGVLAGAIYGILQCLQSPQFYEPMQVLLDYPIAFATIGLAGIFKNLNLKSTLAKFMIGASVACFGRYLAHFLSGYFVFSSWMMEGYTALTWSLVYNLYVIADLAIILLVGLALFSSKSLSNEFEKINPVKTEEN
jgi:thiamine transporter